jgi:hypothetical protein
VFDFCNVQPHNRFFSRIQTPSRLCHRRLRLSSDACLEMRFAPPLNIRVARKSFIDVRHCCQQCLWLSFLITPRTFLFFEQLYICNWRQVIAFNTAKIRPLCFHITGNTYCECCSAVLPKKDSSPPQVYLLMNSLFSVVNCLWKARFRPFVTLHVPYSVFSSPFHKGYKC